LGTRAKFPLAKRHKVEAKKDSATAQDPLAKQVGTYDEAELCKLLLEIAAGTKQHGWLPEAVSARDGKVSWIINGARFLATRCSRIIFNILFFWFGPKIFREVPNAATER
jgi:hypothetical protein